MSTENGQSIQADTSLVKAKKPVKEDRTYRAQSRAKAHLISGS